MEIAIPAYTNAGQSDDQNNVGLYLFACNAQTVYRDAKKPTDPWQSCSTKGL